MAQVTKARREGQDIGVRVNGGLAINKPPIHLLLVLNCSSWLSNGRSSHLSLKHPPVRTDVGTLDNVLPVVDFGLVS